MTEQNAGPRLGYMEFKPGLTKRNGYTLLFAAFISIFYLAYLNFVQPLVLNMIGIPADQQGTISGELALLQEIVLIAIVGPVGALADRVGRRKVALMGYSVAALAYLLFPYSENTTQMLLCRGLFAVGVAGVISTISTLIADYPEERSRSKVVATASVLNGLGLVALTPICSAIPSIMEGFGIPSDKAAQAGIGIVAGMALLSGIIISRGIVDSAPGEEKQDDKPFGQLMKEGFAAGKNPRIFVSYLAAFAARGDVVVVGTYLSLWFTLVGREAGMTSAEAVAGAGALFGISGAAGILSGGLFIRIGDKINRVSGLILGMALATAGYFAFGMLESPLATAAYGAAVLLGIGQVSSVIVAQTLIGAEAEPRISGSVIGVFNAFGAVGTLIGAVLGGWLFDNWTQGGPFLMMGMFNFIVMVSAIIVRLRWPGPDHVQTANSAA